MPGNTNNFELKLPSDVLENIPSGHDDMIHYLARYFEGVIESYGSRFQQRVGGAFAGPLSRYEKSILKDFLIDVTLGKLEASKSSSFI